MPPGMPPWWAAKPSPVPDDPQCEELGCWYERAGFGDCHGKVTGGHCVLGSGPPAEPLADQLEYTEDPADAIPVMLHPGEHIVPFGGCP
jgi:hypothetical protein